MRGSLERIARFSRLPEMRVFWVLLPLLAVIFVVDVIYLPPLVAAGSAVVLAATAAVAYFTIARRAKLSQKTRIERNQLRSIVEGMNDPLMVYDPEFRVLFFNPAAERFFGVKKETVLGNIISTQDMEKPGFRRLIQTIFPTLAPAMVRKSKAGEYPQIIDLSFDDPYTELRTTTSLISDEKGQPVGFMKLIRDRTREVSLVKSKNEFITVASHQLRTPITNIQWVLESLSKVDTLDPEMKSIVQNALASSKELSTIVEQLLDTAKIEEGRFGYEFKESDITEFLGTILSEVLPQARRQGIALYFDKPKEPLPPVTIDPEKLGMAFTNLLDNAVRYNVKNGKITVGVRKQPNTSFLEVSVADTGIGIPKEDMEKVFAKFFRASNAVKSIADGSGLGLYIAQNIVRAHGGTIWAESELNRGTTFYFTVPTDPSRVPKREAPMGI